MVRKDGKAMRISKLSAWILIPAGLALSGSAAMAQGYYGDRYDRQDVREDRRDLRNDYAQVNRLRADIERDQYQLDRAWRRGDRNQVRRLQRDMDRDQRKLDALLGDIARDRRDIRQDQRNQDWNRGYRRN
jgi:Asp-tRNA(Asn)/Glu-tRNA(Gln) amidotransferase A subunit family amidase